MDRDEFRALIDKHMDAGTCYVCGKAANPSEGLHGITGAHWDCTQAEARKTDDAIAKADAGLRSIGLKPRRKREGEGATAQKAKALAVAALEAAIGAPLSEVTMWNQQGVYRGPRWDLDAWGVHFSYECDGYVFKASASSLATMTQCLSFKRLKAEPDGPAGFTLWAHKE